MSGSRYLSHAVPMPVVFFFVGPQNYVSPTSVSQEHTLIKTGLGLSAYESINLESETEGSIPVGSFSFPPSLASSQVTSFIPRKEIID